jgi:putative oxidoreductase
MPSGAYPQEVRTTPLALGEEQSRTILWHPNLEDPMARTWNVKTVATTVLVWAITGFLVFVFTSQGTAKFSSTSGWVSAFATWGYPPWFRMSIGALEVLAALLLLVPRTAAYGALLIMVIMLGGMGTHIAHGQPGQVTHELTPFIFATVVAVMRRKYLRVAWPVAIGSPAAPPRSP